MAIRLHHPQFRDLARGRAGATSRADHASSQRAAHHPHVVPDARQMVHLEHEAAERGRRVAGSIDGPEPGSRQFGSGWQQRDDGVEQPIDPPVPQRRAGQNRYQCSAQHRPLQSRAEQPGRQLSTRHHNLENGILLVRHGLDETIVCAPQLALQFPRVLGRRRPVQKPLHGTRNGIPKPRERPFCVGERHHERDRHAIEDLGELRDHVVEVGARPVELVHKDEPWQAARRRLLPDDLGLRLNTAHAVDDDHHPIEHMQAALNLGDEVDVSRRIDDLQDMLPPGHPGGGGHDGDAATAFLRQPIRGCRALIDAADPPLRARIVQDALGQRRLARIDVGHDAKCAQPIHGRADPSRNRARWHALRAASTDEVRDPGGVAIAAATCVAKPATTPADATPHLA